MVKGETLRARRVFHDVTHTSVAKDMSVSCRGAGISLPVNQGGTADNNSSLIKLFGFVGDFLFPAAARS